MYDEGGILTHGRLPENIDAKAGKNLELPDPRKLRSKGRRVPAGGITIDGFGYSHGRLLGDPRLPDPADAPAGDQARRDGHASPTSTRCRRCRRTSRSGTASPPVRRPATAAPGSATRSPAGPIKFDSGQLGYGTVASREVTTGSNVYTTPPLTKPGKTYTYFCRIHPFMRGSIRVKGGKPKKQ